MNKYTFTEEEIKQVESILIGGVNFCTERRKILESFDKNIEVQACPGSGKTTLLVAKIFLLAQKINLKHESICILTHTNVAVDEIKEKIKKAREKGEIDKNFLDNVEKILKYPNYIGTLQSFIDKYLAVPGYLKIYKKRPSKIDDDYVKGLMKKYYYSDIPNSTQKYISGGNNITIGGERITGVIYNPIYDKISKFEQVGQHGCIRKIGEHTTTYSEIIKICKKRIELDGFITFHEANLYALKYLNDNNINLRKLLQNRYKFIFLDEIQDTQGIHIDILNTLFSYGKSITQGFGDKNQAILENNPDNIEFGLFFEKEKIKSSRRLSKEIANTVWKCAINPIELEGIEERNIPVYYFKYKNGEENKLIEFFHEKIKEYSLNSPGNIFKAIGWTHDGIQIFNPNYEGKIIKRKEKFIDYFSIKNKEEFSKGGFKLYKDEILEGIVRGVNVSKIIYGGKGFSKSSFISYLKEYQKEFYINLMSKIYYCTFDIVNNLFSNRCDSYNDLIQLLKGFEIESKKILLSDDFFKNWASLPIIEELSLGENSSINVEFNTIHGIKGETHTGTLLLDMKALSSESNFRILEYIDDDSCKEGEGNNKQKSIKLFYVGMTRATHLLVIGFNEDIKNHDFSGVNPDNIYPK